MSDLFAPIEALAMEWANQPTDYDEDTEQQIEDGHTLLAALAEVRAQVEVREEWAVIDSRGNVRTFSHPAYAALVASEMRGATVKRRTITVATSDWLEAPSE